MIERHYHWQFVASDDEVDSEKIRFGVMVDVVGYISEADALIAAQNVVDRKTFHLTRVWECLTCGFQQATSESLKGLSASAARSESTRRVKATRGR